MSRVAFFLGRGNPDEILDLLMRHLSPEDQLGDAATAHDPKPYPVAVASATRLGGATEPGLLTATMNAEPQKPPKWHREKVPTDAKEAHKWLLAIEEGHADGEVFYHPGRGCNVVKATTPNGVAITPVDHQVGDEEAWIAAGSRGPAPLLKDRPPEKAAPKAKTEAKKGD